MPRSRKSALAVSESVWEVAIVIMPDNDQRQVASTSRNIDVGQNFDAEQPPSPFQLHPASAKDVSAIAKVGQIFGADVDASKTVLNAVTGALASLEANWLHTEGLWYLWMDKTGPSPMHDDSYTLVNMMVRFLAMVPGKLISEATAARLVEALPVSADNFNNILRESTSPVKAAVFGAFVAHWQRVAAVHQDLMAVTALATCVFGVLFDGPMNPKLALVVQHFIDNTPKCAVKMKLHDQQHADAIHKLHEEKRQLVERCKEETGAVKIQAMIRGRHARRQRRHRRMSFGEIQGERLGAVLKAAGVEIQTVAHFDPEEEAEEIRDAVRQYAIEKGCELKIQKSVFIAEVSKRVRQDSLYRDDDSADDSEDDSDPRSAGWMDVEQQV